MKPVIGITAWRRPLPTFLSEQTDLYTLGVEYVQAVTRAGGAPVIVPSGPDAERVLDMLDGLVMSGGDDVHPESYADTLTDVSIGVNRAADQWEIALVRGAAVRRMPVLAICRGMQIMAVAFGGRLVQHLNAVEGHPDFHSLDPDRILRLRHDVSLQPDCTLAHVYGTCVKDVNTIHHQAVTDAGELAVVGTGPGGLIEAIEGPDDWTAWGVQWHPEKMSDDEREQELFRSFVEQTTQYAREKSIERVR